MLGWFIFTPVGFLMDPLFDAIGRALLVDDSSLRGLWGTAYNAPVVALANPTNTIVLGSFVGWVAPGASHLLPGTLGGRVLPTHDL